MAFWLDQSYFAMSNGFLENLELVAKKVMYELFCIV
jgi:hypothetical protein